MSRSVVARVAMSRSASLSNMCSMISYRNGPAQEKRPVGAGYLFRLEWSPKCCGCECRWVGGCLPRTPVVGHPGTVVPGVRLPRSRPARRWRASPAASLPTGTSTGFQPYPASVPDLRGPRHLGRWSPSRYGKRGGRKATPKAKPAPVPAPVAASSAKPNEIRRTDVARRTEASCRTEVSRHTESQTGPGADSRRCLVCQAERDPTYRCCPSYRGVLPNRGVPPYRKPNRPRCQLPSLPRLPSRTRSDVPMLPAAPMLPPYRCCLPHRPLCPAAPSQKATAPDEGPGDCAAVSRCRPSGALREVLLRVHPGQHLPGLLAAHAVHAQRVVLLELLHRRLGAVPEVAVHGAVVEAEVGQGALQVAHVVAAVAVADRSADASVCSPMVLDVAAGLERVVLLRQPAVLLIVAALVHALGGRGTGAVEAVVPLQRLVGGTVHSGLVDRVGHRRVGDVLRDVHRGHELGRGLPEPGLRPGLPERQLGVPALVVDGVGDVAELLLVELVDVRLLELVRVDRHVPLPAGPELGQRVAARQAGVEVVRRPGHAELGQLLDRGRHEMVEAVARRHRAVHRAVRVLCVVTHVLAVAQAGLGAAGAVQAAQGVVADRAVGTQPGVGLVLRHRDMGTPPEVAVYGAPVVPVLVQQLLQVPYLGTTGALTKDRGHRDLLHGALGPGPVATKG